MKTTKNYVQEHASFTDDTEKQLRYWIKAVKEKETDYCIFEIDGLFYAIHVECLPLYIIKKILGREKWKLC